MKTDCSIFLFSIVLVCCGSYNGLSQTFNDLHDFNCSTEGCNPQYPAILTQERDGNICGTMLIGGTYNYGTLFCSTPEGIVTVPYTFDGNLGNGVTPHSGLTLGLDGNLYGTTVYGGAHAEGTIFKFTPGGTISTIYSFTGAGGTTCPQLNKPDGGQPWAPPIQARDARFNGVTTMGTAYSVGASGGFKALCNFVSPSVALPYHAESPVIQGTNGKFYGTSGGAVYSLTSTGFTAIVHQFVSADGTAAIGPLIEASDGKLYGTTADGGPLGSASGVVFRMTLNGSSYTVLHAFDRYNKFFEGYSPFAGVVEATDGNLYGSTEYGGDPNCGPFDKGCGVLFKLTKGGVYTVLHTFHAGEAGQPQSTQFQHTNGKIYGLLNGPNYSDGAAIYSLDVGLPPFVQLRTTSGKAGQVIPIQGYQLTGTTHVKFGTGDATFSVVADGWITAVVPVTGTTGSITVVTPSGTLTSSKPFKVIPTITSINPTSGAVGSQVVITGTGLTQVSKVTFGGVKAAVFTVNSATQVTAIVPTAAITGKVAVTTPGGSGASPVIFTVNP